MGDTQEGGKLEEEPKTTGVSAPADDDGDPKSGGDAEAPATATFVFKMNMHCVECAKKIKRIVKRLAGVKDVMTDFGGNKLLTVVGNIDPAKVREALEEKTKRKVTLLSPKPMQKTKYGGGGEEKKCEGDDDVVSPAPAPAPAAPKEKTVMLRVKLHCDCCIMRIKKIIMKIGGVETVSIDKEKDIITIKGKIIDVEELVPFLKRKIKRNVQVVDLLDDATAFDEKGKGSAPAFEGGEMKNKGGQGVENKKKGIGGGDVNRQKKNKKDGTSGGCGEKKTKEGSGGDDGEKKLKKESGGSEQRGDGGQQKKSGNDGQEKEGGNSGGGGEQKEGSDGGEKAEDGGVSDGGGGATATVNKKEYVEQQYPKMTMYWYGGEVLGQAYPREDKSLHRDEYGSEIYRPYGQPEKNGLETMFSDENPNGCFIM